VQLVAKTKSEFDYHYFYGTSREPLGSDPSGNAQYSGVRDSKLHYGIITMHIPIQHRLGSEGTMLGTVFGYDPKLTLTSVRESEDRAFWDEVKSDLSNAAKSDDIVVYIHGFGDSFSDAAMRAGQLGVDLGIPDYHLFLFSWASRGEISPSAYFADEATIDASEQSLKMFLTQLARALPGKYLGHSTTIGRRVDIIAHSMGNRALLRVLGNTLDDIQVGDHIAIGHLILAAPDVDAHVFAEYASDYTERAEQTTVYMSPFDEAVRASQWIHSYPRVGCGTTPNEPVDHIDYVVSYQTGSFFSIDHSDFATQAPFIADIKSLIHYDLPSRPTPLWKYHKTSESHGYWTIGQLGSSSVRDSISCIARTEP
jgi:esterase/lipase superfamily enzyme